jgi:hypothetical protein
MPTTELFSRRFYNPGTYTSAVYTLPTEYTVLGIRVTVDPDRTVTDADGMELPLIDGRCEMVAESSVDGLEWRMAGSSSFDEMAGTAQFRISPPAAFVRGRLTVWDARVRLTIQATVI